MVRRPYRRAGGCQESHPKVWEWLRGHPRMPGVVVRTSREAERDWEAFLEVREWSDANLDGLEALPDSQEWLGGPPKGPRLVGRP